jgi:hypothetical protein
MALFRAFGNLCVGGDLESDSIVGCDNGILSEAECSLTRTMNSQKGKETIAG